MARPKIKPNIDPKKLTTNPFSLNPDFFIKAHDVETSTSVIATKDISDSVITKSPSFLKSTYLAEKESFTKVYSAACHRKRIMALPPRALSLYLFITLINITLINIDVDLYEFFKLQYPNLTCCAK